MSKPAKYILTAFAVFAVIAAAGILTVRKMFPPEKIRAILTAKLSQALGRETRLGNVQVGLFKGIRVDDFALSEFPDFKSGTFVAAKSFTLKFSLWPLLQKKAQIDKVLLESPQITIVRYADGKTFNFTTLLATGAAKQPAGTPEPKADEGPKSVSLSVSQAAITQGRLEFIDKGPEKIKLKLDPVNLTVLGTEISKPVSLDLSVKAAGRFQGKDVAAQVALKCVLDLMAARVNIEKLTAKSDELSLDLKGKIHGFTNPDLDLTLSADDLNFAALGRWGLPKDFSFRGSPILRASVKGKMTGLICELEADFTKAELAMINVFRKDSQLPMTLSFSGAVWNQNDVEIRKLALKIANFESAVKGKIQNLKSPAPKLKLDVNTGTFEIKEIAGLLSAAKGYEASGQAALEARVNGSLKAPAVSGEIKLSNIKAKVQNYVLDGVTGIVKLTDEQIEIPKLEGKVGVAGKGEIDFDVRGLVQNYRADPDVTLNASFKTVDLGMFASDKKDAAKGAPQGQAAGGEKAAAKGPVIKTKGQIKIDKVVYTKFEGQDADASWKLTGLTPALDKLSGTAQFKMGAGKIKKIPLLEAISKFTRGDPSALAFNRMGGNLNFTNGTARTEDFEVLSPNADLFAKGTVYLPKNTPDMVLVAKLPKGSIGGTIGDFSNDAEGRPTFSFKLKENWNPKLDTSQIQKRASEEIKKKATEVLQNEGRKLLEGIFKP